MSKTVTKASAVANGHSGETPSQEELALINAYTRKALTAQEVYVFSVALCDNEIDRDGERFTAEALQELEKLFVGKTGIFDHTPSARNQTARIFSCCTEQPPGKTTSDGIPYVCLTARAYMPRTQGNAELIAAIDSGIIKEVSVGCAVERVLCSICGEPIGSCAHRKGERYGGKICCGELTQPYDAYEWSFVAVPAQKQAGVIKAYGKEDQMEAILKKLEERNGMTLDQRECEKLWEYVAALKSSAADGVYYRESLTSEVLRLSAAVQPGISRGTMERVAKQMTVAQLREFKTAFEQMRDKAFAPAPQLYRKGDSKKNNTNGQFTI